MKFPSPQLEEALSAMRLCCDSGSTQMNAPGEKSARRAEKSTFDPSREAHRVVRLAINRTPQNPDGDVDLAIRNVRAYADEKGWGVLELVGVWDEVSRAFDHEQGINVAADIAHVQGVIDAVTAFM